jgi:hypothetical protein
MKWVVSICTNKLIALYGTCTLCIDNITTCIEKKKIQYYKPDKILKQVREVELGVSIPCRYIYAFVLNDNIYEEDTFEVEKRLEN